MDLRPGRFDKAIETVFKHEGISFVNDADDADDPGGPANYGVSLRWLRGLGDTDHDGWLEGDFDGDRDVDLEDIANMNREEALELYYEHRWRRYRFYQIESDPIAGKVFDLAVNMGPRPAARLLQQALAAVGHPVEVDGSIGPKTRAAIVEATPPGGDRLWTTASVRPVPALVAALRSEAAGRYRALVAAKPDREKWLRGWLRRAYS